MITPDETAPAVTAARAGETDQTTHRQPTTRAYRPSSAAFWAALVGVDLLPGEAERMDAQLDEISDNEAAEMGYPIGRRGWAGP